MDGEFQYVRLVTELGSFGLLVAVVFWMMVKAAPRHFAAQEKIASDIKSALSEQRKAHQEERQYLRDTQERQHRENVDAINRLARAITGRWAKRHGDRANPDDKQHQG